MMLLQTMSEVENRLQWKGLNPNRTTLPSFLLPFGSENYVKQSLEGGWLKGGVVDSW